MPIDFVSDNIFDIITSHFLSVFARCRKDIIQST